MVLFLKIFLCHISTVHEEAMLDIGALAYTTGPIPGCGKRLSLIIGKHNICNIFAAVAIRAPLEDIARGIEEVDAVPGRCELIDEEQAFGVIVDRARTPDALSRLLDSIRELKPRRIITVISCCGEKEQGQRPMITKIAIAKVHSLC